MLRFWARVVLVVLPFSRICSAGTLSLEQALAIALQNNTAVTNAQLERAAAEDDVAALRTARYPRLDLSGGISHNFDDQEYTFDEGVWGDYPNIGEIPGEDITINSTNGTASLVSAGVTQPLAQQYRLALSVEQGEVKQDIAEQLLRMTQQDVARVVKQTYFEILQTQSDLRATRESIVFYTSLAELVSNYVSQQIAFDYELQETRARLARRELDAVSQGNRLSAQKERMNSLLARDITTPFEVLELPREVVLPGELEDALATALAQRPEIRESQLKVRDAELGYDIKKAEYLPDVDLSVRYRRLYDTTLIPDTEAYVGLHARWEFFDWGRKSSELASKSNQLQQATNSARQLEDRVAIDVRRSFRAIGEAEEAVLVAQMSQSAARDKLRVLGNQYQQRSTLLQNVLDAESDLDKANNAYHRAVLSVWKAQAELERAIGELLVKKLPAILLSLALFTACGREPATPVSAPTPVRVETAQLLAGDIGLTYSAQVIPDTQVDVAFRTDGYIVAIREVAGTDTKPRLLQPGDTVQRGDVLARVDDEQYRDQVRKAEADLEKARAAARKGEQDFGRARALNETQSITAPDFDAAEKEYATANAAVEAALAQVDEAKLKLTETELVAPLDGTVLQRNIEPGSLVHAQTVGFVVANTRVVKVVFGVPDTMLGNISLGSELAIHTESLPGRSFTGVVTQIAPAADQRTRIFEVSVSVDNTDGALRSGMVASLDVSQTARTAGKLVVVPMTALVQGTGGAFALFTVEDEGGGSTAVRREVQTGAILGNRIAVSEGLEAGAQVIVTGTAQVSDGQAVKVVP